MIPRRLLAVLVLTLPILVVAFAVVMGGQALAQATGDASGARGLFWVGMSCLMLLVVDLLLLVMALGINAMDQRDAGSPAVRRETDEP